MTEQAEKQPFWEQLGLPAPNTTITQEAFESLPVVPFHMEWHEGTVIYPHWSASTMSPSPTSNHQRTVMQTIKLLLKIIRDGTLITAPMDLQLGGRIIQPDLFLIAPDGACTDHEIYYAGPPDLVVEVLSPGNTKNDRVTKFDLYESNGVPEYWIINPTEAYTEVYTLSDGIYRRLGAFKPDQSFTSPTLTATIPVAAIFTA